MFKFAGITIALSLSGNLMAKETIRLVAGDSFPPLMWQENGVAKGVAVEIGKAILEKAGYKVVVEACPWARCQMIAENDGAFITGFSKNDERIKKFIYSNITMYDEVVIVTKKGKEFSFKNTNDLKGKKIGAQLRVSFGPKYEELKKGMIIETDSDDVARVKKIILGRLDGGIFSLGEAGIAYSAKLAGHTMKELSILPDIIAKDPNYLATGSKTPHAKEKINKINAAIKALTNNGTIAKITRMTF